MHRPLHRTPYLAELTSSTTALTVAKTSSAQLNVIAGDFDAADSPIGVIPKTDMEARILLVGVDANQTLDAFDESAIREFIQSNTTQ